MKGNMIPGSWLAVAVAMAATLALALGSPAKAQERSNVWAPIDCTVGVDCNDVGESRLLRTNDGVSINLVTTVEPDHAHTVWWVVFNNPNACTDSCGLDDLARPAVNATVMWATGDVSDRHGAIDLTAHLNEGELPLEPFGLPGDDDGLVNADKAEIHAVVRSHGPVLKDQLSEQITSFGGGCEEDVGLLLPPEIPNNPGECADIQFAIHAAP